MSTIRFQALKEVQARKPLDSLGSFHLSEVFGTNVFNDVSMKEFLSEEAFEKVIEARDKGISIDRKISDQVATSMKSWAMSKGATHYTHWFQPLTGRTAEKHDSFLSPIGDGRAIERFEGNQLVQQEPDASSFPSGGLRNTFEARGYTAWDPTSPAFIYENTLCIPTVFVSYTGHALDFKAPLLKSITALDKAATSVAKYFDKNINRVYATLGWEQEYFLVDTAFYKARPDLTLTGRTLFGQSASKGQQLDDHYFGSIPERALRFMKEFEVESLKLGIPVTTRHNEVAPNQFECAPMFEEINLANDHNLLLMDVMEEVARKHHFHLLLHEKPFAGMNGSGKHNNWSLSTDTGKNLLSPGNTPKTNLRFLTYFVNTIKALHEHADLIRAAISGAGNDHRLGANEAPPAIISAFIGSQLTSILDDIEKSVSAEKLSPETKTDLKLKVGRIPEIMRDNTDRNRTSPFAFTGNKFELRAVGSTANCAQPMIMLNTMMAEQLTQFKKDVDALIKKGNKKDDAIFSVLKRYIVESKAVRFEGNGYSEDWVKEAKKRGLSNLRTTPEALRVYLRDESKELFLKHGILRDDEMEARYEIEVEKYKLKLQIESRVMADLAINQIVPAALKYQRDLLTNYKGLVDLKLSKNSDSLKDAIEEIAQRVDTIKKSVHQMIEERKKANTIESVEDQADAYCEKVLPYFDVIRYEVDKLEFIVSDELWPLPKYREMLFTK